MKARLLTVTGPMVLMAACATFADTMNKIGDDIGKNTKGVANDVVGGVANLDKEVAGFFGKVKGLKKETLGHPAASKFSPEQEYHLGRTVIAELLAQRYDNSLVGVKGKGASATATPGVAYVQSVGQVVAAAAERSEPPPESGEEDGERVPTTMRVAVVKATAPNAYSVPGGFVMITTGMLELVETEDELAAVLAHEMAHISLGHPLNGIEKGKRAAALKSLIDLEEIKQEAGQLEKLGLKTDELAGHLDSFADDIVLKLVNGYPKDWELAADTRGTEILKEAGYDPAAMGSVMAKLGEWLKANTDGKTQSKYPSTDKRQAIIAETAEPAPAPEAVAKRRAARFDKAVPPLRKAGALARR